MKNKLVIQPVNLDGEKMHLAIEFDPSELEGKTDVEKLSFFSDLANKLKSVISKVGNMVNKPGTTNLDAVESEIMELDAVPVKSVKQENLLAVNSQPVWKDVKKKFNQAGNILAKAHPNTKLSKDFVNQEIKGLNTMMKPVKVPLPIVPVIPFAQ